jgi:tRNA U55 pseudouridine synthase TruB
VGQFRVEDALPLAVTEELSREELADRIVPLSSCLPGMRPIVVDAAAARQLRQGRTLVHGAVDLHQGEQVRVLTDSELVAVAQVRNLAPQTVLAPVRVFGSS